MTSRNFFSFLPTIASIVRSRSVKLRGFKLREEPDELLRLLFGFFDFLLRVISDFNFRSIKPLSLSIGHAATHLVDRAKPVVVEVKTGSSGAGAEEGLASHHPERSGVMRSFKPTGHRHTAELEQELTGPSGERPTIAFSATAVEAVRGVLATSHVFLQKPTTERDLWKVYRSCYGAEPFIRLVKENSGVFRYPEPKILTGSNYCDIGFELDEENDRVVVLAAIDNLMKGASGQAVQAMNIRFAFPEEAGLEFAGLHPI